MHPAQIEELVRRLVANPHDEAALGHAHNEGQADPRGYATVLERVGEGTSDPAYAAHWLSEAAAVWSSSLNDARRAAMLLMRAVEKDPANAAATDRLEQLYREKNDVSAIVALHTKRAKLLTSLAASDPGFGPVLAAVHEQIGRLYQEPPLSQPRKAIEAYKKAVEADPNAVSAIYQARELLKAEGNVKEALPLYEAELRVVDDPERRLMLLRDEAQARQSIGDGKGASATLRQARGLDPNDPSLGYELASSIITRIQGGERVGPEERDEAAAILVSMAESYDGEHALAYSEAALDAVPGHDRAMQLAQYFAEGLGRRADLAPRWAEYLKANPGGTYAIDARKELASIYEGQGRLEDAIAALEPIADDPDPSIGEQLESLYSRAGKTAKLAAHVDKKSVGLPPAERAGKLAEVAQMLAQKGDKKGALAKYQEVLAVDAQQPDALAFVEDALRSSRQYKELRDVLLAASRMPTAPIDTRRAQLREVAGLSESQLRDPEGALAAYRALLALDRTDETARAALHRLLEKSHGWDELAGLLEQEAMSAGDIEAQIALEKKLADLHEQKRKDKRSAAEALLRVVQLAPHDESTLGRAVALLLAEGEEARVVQVIDEAAGELEPGPGKGKLLLQLGELREKLGDRGGASDAFAEAGELLNDAAVWKRAEEAAVAVERWDQAAAAAGRRGDLETAPGSQATLRATEADYLTRGGDTASAILRLEQAVDLAPEDVVLSDRLAAAYQSEGRFDDLAAFHVRRGENAKEPAATIGHFKAAAKLRKEHLGDGDGARELLMRAADAGHDEEALLMLVDDATDRGEPGQAVDYLRRLQAKAVDKPSKIRIALREAALLADAVGDVDAGVAKYREVLDGLDEHCREALQAIADLEQARERFPEAADALERDLELAAAGEEKANIARRLGEIYVDHTKELGKSIAAFEVVVREDGEDFAALQKLRELCERAEKWPRVLELLDAQIEVEGDDDEIATLTSRKAEVLAEQMKQPDEALRTLAPLTVAGSDVARVTALAIADRHDAHAQIGGQILAWARTTGGAEGQRLLGEAFDRFARGGAKDRALEIALDVLRTPRGKDLVFLETLEGLAAEAKSIEILLEAHDRRASLAAGAARAEELVRQAKARVAVGIEPREAVEHGELGLNAVPPAEAQPLVEALAALLPEPWSRVALYERQIPRAKAPADRLAACVRAYRAAIEVDLPDDKTRELSEAALAVSGADDPFDVLWEAASAVDAEREGQDKRRALVDAVVAATGGPRDGGRTRSANLRKAARKVQEAIGDEGWASELLAQALVAHVDAAALDAVEELTAADGKRAEAIFTRALEDVFDGPLVRQILSRRASLRKDRLDDTEGALVDLKKLHELAPADASITERYAELLSSANDYRGLISLHEDQILRSKDQNVRADLARKIALLWEERLGEAREAADAWRRVLRLRPNDPEGTAGLDRAKKNKLSFEEGKFPPQRASTPSTASTPPRFSRSEAPAAKKPSIPPPVPSPVAPTSKTMSVPPPAVSNSEAMRIAERTLEEPRPSMLRSRPPMAPPSSRPAGTPPSRPPTKPPSRPPLPRSVPRLDALTAIPDVTDENPIFSPPPNVSLPKLTDDEDEVEDMATLVGEPAAPFSVPGAHIAEHTGTQEVDLLASSEIKPETTGEVDIGDEAELVDDDEAELVDDGDVLETGQHDVEPPRK
jgi:hypothetical protein